MKRKKKIESIRSSTMEPTKKKLSIRSLAMEQTKKNECIRSSTMKRTKKNECIRSSTMKRTKKNEGIRSSTIDVLPLLSTYKSTDSPLPPPSIKCNVLHESLSEKKKQSKYSLRNTKEKGVVDNLYISLVHTVPLCQNKIHVLVSRITSYFRPLGIIFHIVADPVPDRIHKLPI
jgi:hypothetical protein